MHIEKEVQMYMLVLVICVCMAALASAVESNVISTDAYKNEFIAIELDARKHKSKREKGETTTKQEFVDPKTHKKYMLETPVANAHSTLETKAKTKRHKVHKRQEASKEGKGFFDSAMKVAGKVSKAISKVSNPLLSSILPDSDAAKIEDCTACRYVWGRVEMDIANTRSSADIQASFERQCMDAQTTAIFFKPVSIF